MSMPFILDAVLNYASTFSFPSWKDLFRKWCLVLVASFPLMCCLSALEIEGPVFFFFGYMWGISLGLCFLLVAAFVMATGAVLSALVCIWQEVLAAGAALSAITAASFLLAIATRKLASSTSVRRFRQAPCTSTLFDIYWTTLTAFAAACYLVGIELMAIIAFFLSMITTPLFASWLTEKNLNPNSRDEITVSIAKCISRHYESMMLPHLVLSALSLVAYSWILFSDDFRLGFIAYNAVQIGMQPLIFSAIFALPPLTNFVDALW